MTPYDPSLSDGCSIAPDLSIAVRACCVAHDAAYYLGGTWADWFQANVALGWCIWATDWAFVAVPYAIATTLCGWLFWPRKRRR